MAQSIKLGNDTYLDASGIVFGPSHQILGAALDQVSSIVKSSTSSSTTVTFSYTGNRYTGILLILNNTGTSAVYAVGFKKSQQSFVTKLAGGTSSATMDADGTISVPLSAWSSAMVFAITDNTAFT